MTCDGATAPTTLGDHLTLQRGTTYKSSLLGQPGPVLLGLASIQRNGGFRDDKLRTYGGDSPEKLILRPGELYVSLKDVTQSGDLLGAVSRVPPTVAEGRLTQDTVKLEISDPKIQPSYLYWLLRTPEYRSYCRARSMGTTNLSLSRADFLAFPVAPMTTSRLLIVRTLELLDDKIDRDRRLARVCEELAHAEYEARLATSTGRRDLTEAEVGSTHNGWTAAPIGDLLKVVGGSTPSTKEPRYWDGGTHCWATPRDLAGLRSPVVLETARHITDDGVKRISSRLLPERTVLLSSRAPVGYTAITMVELAVNQGFIAIPPSGAIPSEFVLFWLREYMDRIRAHAGGTTFAEISKRAFRPLVMHVPPSDALRQFEAVARPLLDLIAAMEREIRTLAETRNALLHKLTAGGVPVPEPSNGEELIEKIAEVRPV